MNKAYRDLVLSRVQAAIGAATAVAPIKHAGLRGLLRETLVKDLFRPLLPADIGIGHGAIVSAVKDEQSPEQDVILYDRRILPPIQFEDHSGIYPIEAVLFGIEVKSRLDAGALRASHTAAERIRNMPYQSGARDARGTPVVHDVEKVISAVFALDSDLSGGVKTELDRYHEVRGDEYAAIRIICVVNRGLWFCHGDTWHRAPSTYPLEEVVRFLGNVMNAFSRVAETRRQPELLGYLAD